MPPMNSSGIAQPGLPLFALVLLALAGLAAPSTAQETRPPNVVYILADDLGWGELGSYGQTRIKTPNLDRLAKQGVRFTRHYAGAPVCAPSRCVLMTGRELSKAEIRGNKEVKPEGQWPMSADAFTVAEFMQAHGYVTGAMGKWGLGPVESTGDPNAQGFDLFFGYNCQREAHNLYPSHLWLNRERYLLNNRRFRPYQKLKKPPTSYARFEGDQYAPQLIADMALAFLRQHKDEPFFLYAPFVEPHLALQPPEEWVNLYPKAWDDKPYLGTRGYLPHPRPHAAYAALITHLDDHVGKILDLLEELGLEENTLVMFTSDNGPTHDVGGVDTTFFKSSGGLRGRKGSVYEGGLRVPFIARWPGHIEPGSTSSFVSGFQDLFPTLADLVGARAPENLDGVSILPALLGKASGPRTKPMVWEFFGYGGQRAVIDGRWKAVQRGLRRKKGPFPLEIYDLEVDPFEEHDLSSERPNLARRLRAIMLRERTDNPVFPVPVPGEGR